MLIRDIRARCGVEWSCSFINKSELEFAMDMDTGFQLNYDLLDVFYTE